MRKWFFYERFSYFDLIVILTVIAIIRTVLGMVWS